MKVVFLSKQSHRAKPFFFFEFPRGVRRDALTSASSSLKRSLCERFFRTRACVFRTPHSLFVRVRFTKPLFLSSTQKEAQKHTTDSSSSYYYERERVPFSIHLLRTTKRTETMKFSSRFSFFAFATLFFHQAARVDVVQAAPAMMFFSPPPVARRHLVKEEEEEKATAFSSMHSKSSKETEDNVALYAGRVQNERMVLEKLLVGGLFQSENDDDDDEMKAEVTIVLDQPRWTAEDDEQMAKFLSFSKSSSSTVSSVFAPRFSRFRGGGKQTQQQRQHAVKEEIEKRFSVASTAENSRDENSLGGRVRYWNCDDEKEDFEYATRTTTTKTDELDERVKAILGDLTRRSKEDKEPTDRVGIVMCGGEDKEDDLALFRALMKALGAAERTFVAGVLGGETAGRVEGSGNSGGNADCTRDAEKREKRRDLLFSKGSGSQVNECDDLCQLHVSIVSGLIIFWIFAGTFTYGMGMMSNLDTPKIYEKSDE